MQCLELVTHDGGSSLFFGKDIYHDSDGGKFLRFSIDNATLGVNADTIKLFFIKDTVKREPA